MPVVLVTVVGPTGRLDLVVPGEPPVAALLDPLLQALGGARARKPSGSWLLSPLGGDPLDPGESLTDAGIRDGAVLVLGDGRPPAGPATRSGRSPVVGVLSAAAGMGRTTVAAILAGALAAGTPALTVAVDADPGGTGGRPTDEAPGSGAGSLSERLAPAHDVTASDLLALIDHPALTRPELLAFLAWCGPRLGLLPGRPERDRGPPLAERDWTRLLRGLVRQRLTLVLDCGPGLDHPGTRAVLAMADQVVLVVEPQLSPASRGVAGALADQGLPTIAVPWPAPPWSGTPGRPNRAGAKRPAPQARRAGIPPRPGAAAGSPPSARSGLPPSSRSWPPPGGWAWPPPGGWAGVPTGRWAGPPTGRWAGVPTGRWAGPPTGRWAGVPPSAWAGIPRGDWDLIWRVAETLVADWRALGLTISSEGDRDGAASAPDRLEAGPIVLRARGRSP